MNDINSYHNKDEIDDISFDIIECFNKGIYNWIQVVNKKHPHLTRDFVRYHGNVIKEKYGRSIINDTALYVDLLNTKFFEYANKLEEAGEYEGAAKMYDRISKLLNLHQPQQIEISHSWKVNYNIDDNNIIELE